MAAGMGSKVQADESCIVENRRISRFGKRVEVSQDIRVDILPEVLKDSTGGCHAVSVRHEHAVSDKRLGLDGRPLGIDEAEALISDLSRALAFVRGR